MNLLNFSIIKLTICLILGILIGHFFQFSIVNSTILTVTGIVITVFLFSFRKQKQTKTILGVCFLLTTMIIGILVYNFHNHLNFNNHYTKLELNIQDTEYNIRFRVREVLKPGRFHDKYVIDILKINDSSVSGKSLLNIEKDSLDNDIEVDDISFIRTSLKDLNSPLNPHQFNYKAYLRKNNIFHQVYSKKDELLLLQRHKNTAYGHAFSLRKSINKNLSKHAFEPNELAIINALLLGQRQDISEDIYNSYTQAGVIHILAVSGLHVGIILIILQILFKPLKRYNRGHYFSMFLIVVLLWTYAILAGLSASVVRAVTMFTILAIAMNLKRPTNVFNTLAISVFILLLFKPTFLFDVGFQMSYLAVLGIILIQPILSKWWKPSNKIYKFFWNILTVTIAAQFGIVPISLYYFHQFPGLFFISNLVIIPFLGFILSIGILVIVLSAFNMLPQFLADIYGQIISQMNTFVSWVSSHENFLFQDISFNIFQVIVSYLIIGSILWFYKLKSYKAIVIVLMVIISIQVQSINKKSLSARNKFIVFHKSRHTLLGLQTSGLLKLYHNLENITNEKLITNYNVGENIIIEDLDSIKPVYNFDDKWLLVVDSLGLYKINSIEPQIVLLRDSPKINLNRLIQKLKPRLIISDGSNYKNYQDRWQLTCKENQIPFHRTSDRGAFIYDY